MRFGQVPALGVLPLVCIAACLEGCSAQAAGASGREMSAKNGVTLPSGYRDLQLVTIAREQGRLDDLRAILGNRAALQSFREEQRPFPDGSIIVRIAWSYESAAEDDKVLGDSVSHVAGVPKNGVQVMVKDSRRYAASGGWGFAQFNDGRPAAETVQATCEPCHTAARSRDLVFSRYAP